MALRVHVDSGKVFNIPIVVVALLCQGANIHWCKASLHFHLAENRCPDLCRVGGFKMAAASRKAGVGVVGQGRLPLDLDAHSPTGGEYPFHGAKK